MSRSGEAYIDYQADMEDYEATQEECAFYSAVQEVKGFIEAGSVTLEQVEAILRGEADE
ncbi:MAG: hypothetical protein ACE5DY_09115 [Mariprofundaceae bacterium]